MKKFILILAVMFFNNVTYSQWFQQNSNTLNTLNSVYFVNSTTGWACGFETIVKTTDCGNTWATSFLQGYHKSVFFIDGNTGFVCGENGSLYKSDNGGVNWIQVNSTVSTTLNQIVFYNQFTGIISGSNKIILKTTDSGNSWSNVNNHNTSLDFHSVKILNHENYIVTGTESSIYITSNAGASWDTLSLGMTNPLLTVEFINQNTGWVSGCCGMFMKTINGGLNWSPEVYLTPGFSINSVKFVDENSGWVAGDAGYILRTTNGGHSWDSLNSLSQSGLYSVYFLNKDTGFAVGYNGLILKTFNGGGIGFPLNIAPFTNEIPENYFLDQNYPNPFNPTSNLRFGILNLEFVTLNVYDITGKKVAELVNGNLSPGRYEVKFDGSKLSSGIYFYILKTDKFIESKSMILLK